MDLIPSHLASGPCQSCSLPDWSDVMARLAPQRLPILLCAFALEFQILKCG